MNVKSTSADELRGRRGESGDIKTATETATAHKTPSDKWDKYLCLVTRMLLLLLLLLLLFIHPGGPAVTLIEVAAANPVE